MLGIGKHVIGNLVYIDLKMIADAPRPDIDAARVPAASRRRRRASRRAGRGRLAID